MAELYLFNNSGIYYAFTPTIFSKTFGGNTYLPTLLTRSSIELTDNFAKSPLVIKFERTHSFARSLLNEIPETPIILTIYKDNQPYWQGRVIDAKANLTTIEVACDSNFASTVRAGVQAKITPQCRHLLYSANCGIVEAVWAVTYNNITANSTIVTVTGLSQPDNYFSGGKVEMDGQVRYILKQIGSVITLSSPFTGILVGTIRLFPGCNLTQNTMPGPNCTTFSNLANFGGFAYLPAKNPFDSTGLL